MGRFQITKETCQMLMDFHKISIPFLDCVHAFGCKVEEDSRIWDGCYTFYDPNSDNGHFGA